jgi:DNA-binding MarR family transcriptional regulator
VTQHLTEQADQLHRAVTALVKKYQFRDRNDICCYGISVSQCYTLETLREQGTLSMQALADQLRLAVSTVTRIVDQLVDKRLVKRQSDPRDRRICQVQLTAEGKRLFHTIRTELVAREQAILQRIPVASRDHVIWAIAELSRALDDRKETEELDYANTHP